MSVRFLLPDVIIFPVTLSGAITLDYAAHEKVIGPSPLGYWQRLDRLAGLFKRKIRRLEADPDDPELDPMTHPDRGDITLRLFQDELCGLFGHGFDGNEASVRAQIHTMARTLRACSAGRYNFSTLDSTVNVVEKHTSALTKSRFALASPAAAP